MEVRPGYKKTEVGVIPEDWEIMTVGDFAEVKGGKRLPLGKNLVENPTPYPYIRVTDMRFGGVALDEIKYVPKDVFPSIRNYRIWSSDIFISVAGTLGMVGKIPSELDGANLTENADRITSIRCDRDFLLYNLMSERIQNAIESEKTVGAQPKLALNKIQNFIVALPPTKNEQCAIALALGDVDVLLAYLEQLIDKKRDLKQGVMQQLLTGETRLPGFDQKWEMMRLGDLANLHRESVEPAKHPKQLFAHFSLPAFDSNRMPVVEYGKEIGSNKFRVPQGAVLVSKLNPRIPRVWAPNEIPEQSIASTEFLILLPKKTVSRDFLHVICSSTYFCNKMESAATGTTGSHQRMNPTEALGIKLSIPVDATEQCAIAGVLSDMVAEVDALEVRLKKTRALKQGMMQELLTGKTRLA